MEWWGCYVGMVLIPLATRLCSGRMQLNGAMEGLAWWVFGMAGVDSRIRWIESDGGDGSMSVDVEDESDVDGQVISG
jgi:hypothetical protein